MFSTPRRPGRKQAPGLDLVLLLLLLSAAAAGCQHGRGRTLLAEGKLAEVLETVRPVDAVGHVLRARALRRMGRLREARTELLLGRSRDTRSAELHKWLGFVELELGNEGAALAALERALALGPRQTCVRRAVARLLLRRAHYRSDPGLGLLQQAEARREISRAARLDPCLEARAARLREALRGRPPPDRHQRRGRARCPGVPLALEEGRDLPPPRGPARCRLQRPTQLRERARSRYLLLGCEGVQVARRLERYGCLGDAYRIWLELAREAPTDPRWPLQAARVLLVQGKVQQAKHHLLSHVFLTKEKATAQIAVARLLLRVGLKSRAARAAIDAISFVERLDQQLELIRIIKLAGFSNQARKVAQITIEATWPDVGTARVKRLVEEAIRVSGDPR
jgi:tetratricopeptide (TPR) repeat protein